MIPGHKGRMGPLQKHNGPDPWAQKAGRFEDRNPWTQRPRALIGLRAPGTMSPEPQMLHGPMAQGSNVPRTPRANVFKARPHRPRTHDLYGPKAQGPSMPKTKWTDGPRAEDGGGKAQGQDGNMSPSHGTMSEETKTSSTMFHQKHVFLQNRCRGPRESQEPNWAHCGQGS